MDELNQADQVAGGKTYNPLHVNLPAYEGPLDLLLDLIKKNEMDIYNIPIAEITKEYLDYLNQMRQFDLEIAGEFLVMAATLVWIKSKMLLPIEEGQEEEEGGDPRAELVKKLLEYQAFREAAKELGLLEHERAKVFTRQITDYYLANLSADEPTVDTFSANLFDLLEAFRSVLKGISKEQFHQVFEEVITIEEKMAQVKEMLMQHGSIQFRWLFEGENITKNVIIVTFLALLELVRSRFARIVQEKQFGDILISRI